VKRGIGHDVVRAAGQTEIAGIAEHYDYLIAKSFPKAGCPARMRLDGDDGGARGEQGSGDRAGAGADIEHQGSWGQLRFRYQPGCPARVELVPPIASAGACHGDAP
jgi:hypothetical protein